MDSQISEKIYQDNLNWLFSQLPMFSRIGPAAYKPGLDNVLHLDDLYGNPHKKFKSIHVGGTNGKGSTSHMIASVFQKAGYKTGLYTSPHLTDFRERIRINGEMIPKEEVIKFIQDWKNRESTLEPSFFELTMIMAFDWFAREKVDIAVIEVGMGGRLDSTNIITPEISVITNISFDHTAFLGKTLPAIATEKAGIMKKGIPTVIGEAGGEVKEVFERKAEETGSPVVFAEETGNIIDSNHSVDGWDITTSTGLKIKIPLAGLYQKKNIRTVLTVLDSLRQLGYGLSENNIKEGLENVEKLTGLRGRWQLINKNPDIICDTGHNEDGIKETMSTLAKLYSGKKLKFVVGFVNDKDVAHIMKYFPKEADYYFTKASIPRAMDEKEVACYFAGEGIDGKTFPTVKEAVDEAIKESDNNSVIYVGGSTFIVADYLTSLQ